MHNRLKDVVKYKTGGRQRDFAALCGWTPQYLIKLLRGENFGLRPVLTLLKVLPEINARWLLLGEGAMLEDDKMAELRRTAVTHAREMLELERYIPYMSASDLREYEQAVKTVRMPDFSPDAFAEWERRKTQGETS